MMVYLESIRYNPRATLRSIVAGQQVPMELTSLGRAYLAGIPETEREKLIAQFRRRNAAATKALIADVQKSIGSVRRDGYCEVSWQPGVLAVATPIILEGLPVYALNMRMQDIEPTDPWRGDRQIPHGARGAMQGGTLGVPPRSVLAWHEQSQKLDRSEIMHVSEKRTLRPERK
jgi:hypothetical protein